MMTSSISLQSAVALVLAVTLTACGSGDRKRAGQMTSYSANGSPSATPQLFTIPQDQMAHVQVVTVQPTRLTRTLRLTGSVAYNAFNTTPVITQVGGPVSRILVVPGQHVKTGRTPSAWRIRIGCAHRTYTSITPLRSATWSRLSQITTRLRQT